MLSSAKYAFGMPIIRSCPLFCSQLPAQEYLRFQDYKIDHFLHFVFLPYSKEYCLLL